MQPLSPNVAAVMSMMANSFFIFVLLYTGPIYFAPPIVKGTPTAGSNGCERIARRAGQPGYGGGLDSFLLLVISAAGPHTFLMIPAEDRWALSCHLDRRPKAGVERSGHEPDVPLFVSRDHRPDRESFRPGSRFANTATCNARPDFSTPLRCARNDREEGRCAPKKLTVRVPWLRWRSHVFLAAPACLRQRRHGTQSRRLVSFAYPPRSEGPLCGRTAWGLEMTNRSPFPAFPRERRRHIPTTPPRGVCADFREFAVSAVPPFGGGSLKSEGPIRLRSGQAWGWFE
jgi:hypothetical protein